MGCSGEHAACPRVSLIELKSPDSSPLRPLPHLVTGSGLMGAHREKDVPGPGGSPSYDNRDANIWIPFIYRQISPPLKWSLGSEVFVLYTNLLLSFSASTVVSHKDASCKS